MFKFPKIISKVLVSLLATVLFLTITSQAQASEVKLEVPLFDQNIEATECAGNVGCHVTSVAMVLKYLGLNANPDNVREANGGCFMDYINLDLADIDASVTGITYDLAHDNSPAYGAARNNFIKSKIDSGMPVIMGSNNYHTVNNPHWLVIVGYTSDDKWIVNNPNGAVQEYILMNPSNSIDRVDYIKSFNGPVPTKPVSMIDTNSNMWISPNFGVNSLQISADIVKSQTEGQRIGFLYSNGDFKIKEGVYGDAIFISPQIKDFQLSGKRMGILYGDGTFKIKEDTNGTITTISGSIKAFQLEGNFIGLLYNDGTFKVKDGLTGPIYTIDTSVESFQLENEKIAYLTTGKSVRVNPGVHVNNGQNNLAIADPIKQYQLEGNRLGFLFESGLFAVRQGVLFGDPVTVQSTDIAKFALEGNRIGLLYNNGTFKVRENTNDPVITQSDNIKDIKFRGNEIFFLYTNGDYKGRVGTNGPAYTLGTNILKI